MEKTGIIKGATTHINYRLFGSKVVAHIIITIDPSQEEQLTAYVKKMPQTYSVYSRGVQGHIDIITILKTLEQLGEIKDELKRNFAIIEMKTAIWTDVKEMNYNLAIIDENRTAINNQPETAKKTSARCVIDETDRKIADTLAVNGRVSMAALGKEVGISASNAKKRYQKLRENGVLKITIQVNPSKIGYQALCVFFTTISSERLPSIVQKISQIPDVISIMKTTGDYDLQVYAMVQNLDQLLFIREEIGRIDGVSRMDLEINRIQERLEKWPSPRQYISTF